MDATAATDAAAAAVSVAASAPRLPVPLTASSDPRSVAIAALTAVAQELHFEARTTAAGVLQIVLGSTACFASLNTLHEAVKATGKRASIAVEDLLTADGEDLLFVVRIGRKRGRPSEAVERDVAVEAVDKVDQVVSKVKKSSVRESVVDA
jgi:hypothetical protein